MDIVDIILAKAMSEANGGVSVDENGNVYIGDQLIIKHLTQAEYDLLDPPDPLTTYYIHPETPALLTAPQIQKMDSTPTVLPDEISEEGESV